MRKLRRVGVGLSVACAVHCAALPLLAGASAVSHAGFLHEPWVEALLLGMAALIGYPTLGASYRDHRRPLPLALLTTGLVLVVSAHAAEGAHAAAIGGAMLLALAQVADRRMHGRAALLGCGCGAEG